MLNQHNYDYEYFEDLISEETSLDKEVYSLFPSEEEAIFALYEQLFGNINSVCKETIFNSMKYLILSKSMDNQIEEMSHMIADDVDVVHHRQLDKGVEQATKELKKKLYRILEDKYFNN